MSLTGKPSLTTPSPFINDGFWPDLDVGELMDKYRIPPEYADDTIIWGLTLAVTNVNLDLEPVKTVIVALGHASLADYNLAQPEPINSEQVTVIHYKHAVYAYAKAFLLQQFNSLNRKPNAENAAKEAPETEQYWLGQSASAVQRLFAKFSPNTLKSGTANFYAGLM